MIKKNGLLLLALLVAPSLAAMEKELKELHLEEFSVEKCFEKEGFIVRPSKQPHIPAVKIKRKRKTNHPKNSFEEELYKALKRNKVRAMELKAIWILKKVASLNSSEAKNFLDKLPVEDVVFLIPTMVIAAFMKKTAWIQLLHQAFVLHLEKISPRMEKIFKMEDKGEKAKILTKVHGRCSYLTYKYQRITIPVVENSKDNPKEVDLEDLGRRLMLKTIGPFHLGNYQPFFDLIPYVIKGVNYKTFNILLNRLAKDKFGMFSKLSSKHESAPQLVFDLIMGIVHRDEDEINRYKKEMYEKYKRYLTNKPKKSPY